MINSDLASAITVNVSSTTAFNIDSDDLDMSNLPFTPVLNGSAIFKGQRIEAVSSTGMISGGGMGGMMGGGTVNASTIQLEQQGLRGAVSAYSAKWLTSDLHVDGGLRFRLCIAHREHHPCSVSAARDGTAGPGSRRQR